MSESCTEEETQTEKLSSVNNPLMENGELKEYRTFYLCCFTQLFLTCTSTSFQQGFQKISKGVKDMRGEKSTD